MTTWKDSDNDYQGWYEEWWLAELPGRTPADVCYDRWYDWRLR